MKNLMAEPRIEPGTSQSLSNDVVNENCTSTVRNINKKAKLTCNNHLNWTLGCNLPETEK